MKGDNELAALIDAIDGDVKLEVEIGEALGRFRVRRDRAIRDREAADLLHLGWRVVAERQEGICKSAVYKRAERGRTQSTENQAA
jgi:hypothetical protein